MKSNGTDLFARRDAIREQLAVSIGSLQTVGGKVAFVAAMQPHLLQFKLIESLTDLEREFNYAIDMLSLVLAGGAAELEAAVEGARKDFDDVRGRLESEYAPLIEKLTNSVLPNG